MHVPEKRTDIIRIQTRAKYINVLECFDLLECP